MKRRLVSVVAVFTLVLGMAPASVSATDNSRVLQPGEAVTFNQKVPINIVFLGYPQNSINQRTLLSKLPKTYDPIVRFPPLVYGLSGRDMGLHFDFDYKVTFTENSFSNRFFNYLKQIGTPGDPTLFQTDYNDQVHNVLDVTGPVLYIDAPSVEGWLAQNLNVGQKGYTVVFVNWFSRPDFKFHVYTKTDEPDPDTGYNFGQLRASRKMIAWGGSHSRLWFYDLSAGPEAWAGNWNVDDADVDGDGSADYRMPPIWEYRSRGYRAPSKLSSDLGLVTRYVGINLLFTSSPLYDPLGVAPDVSGSKVVHINMLEDDPASQGTQWLRGGFARDRWAAFEPYYDWRTKVVDRKPIDSGARRAFRIFAGLSTQNDCWNAFGDPFAELFCFFEANRDHYVPAYKQADYVEPVFAFNTTDANMGAQAGLLGFADDNWVDGTQSFVFAFDTPGDRTLGYGFTATVVHEVGHHMGMSHPHDGYDSATGVDYGAAGDTYFAWSGDESDTVMQYIGVSNGFGKFDQANMYRWEMAGYLNWANGLLDDILAHPRANRVRGHLDRAEEFAKKAIAGFNAWSYLDAAAYARKAYEEVARAADELGIVTPTESSSRIAAIPGAPPREGDPIRFPNN